MAHRQIIHGLNCPSCGGTLEIEEGHSVVNCPFCGVSSLLTGERGIWHFQVKPGVGQEQVEAAVRRFFRRWDRDPGLVQEAAIQECFVIYVPYWQVSMHAAGWLSGRSIGEDTDTPVEKAIVEDYAWTGAAYDASRFGVRELEGIQGRELEPFDREALQQHALVFQPEGSGSEAIKQAESVFRQAARRRAGITKTLFQRFQFFGQRLSLIHYPLWLVRYTYRGRSYRVVVDGRKVVYGQAPGNPTWRAAILVLALLVGATLPLDFIMWWAWMIAAEPFTWEAGPQLLVSSQACIVYHATMVALVSLSAAILLAGYRFFRFGGERVVGQKGRYFDRTVWPAFTWSVGLFVCMTLALVMPWRLVILIPTFAIVSSASLGLGLWIRHRIPPVRDTSAGDRHWETSWLWDAGTAQTTPVAKPTLAPLHCPNCQALLGAREVEVAYVCQSCGWGLELAGEGLRRIEIAFAAPQPHPGVEGTHHLPFWVFEGDVRLETCDAVNDSLLGREKPSGDRGAFWRETRRFYVPAFRTALPDLRAWGVQLTRSQPDLPLGPSAPLKDCAFTEAEARELAELIFLGIEFDKPDVIQELEYDLTLASPRLMVIPFVGASK